MLESDPKRQAIHPLRGFAYQIWQSLDAWLSISSEEVIFLEGAEDIDKIAPDNAETIQVKDLQSGPLTLNSPEILNAIKHYWEHKTRNPSINIKYRFLTTADRSNERPAVFDGKGLDYWDQCRHQRTNIQPIRDFLISKDSLPKGLLKFIKDSDSELLRSDLIRPIEWDTGNQNREYLEDVINEKLIKLGDKYHVLPSVSKNAFPALLKYVFEKACSEGDRSLTYVQLLEEFESKVTINLPIGQMTKAISTMGEGFNPAGLSGALPSAPIEFSQVNIKPTVPSKFSRRKSLVESLANKILGDKIIVLHGSTGMGKSSIGGLLVKTLSLKIHWLNLRGKDASSIRSIFMNIAINLKSFEDNIIVIDDINFGIDSHICENAFITLLRIVLSKNGYVIITTQNELPDKVSHYIHHIKDLIVDVPVFNLDEIKEAIKLHGCTDEKKISLWGSFIQIKTGGHPQLVHAKIRGLESSRWPTPTVKQLTEPDDFEKIKGEVKKRLLDELPIESARTLSYRLSILHHPFKKSHALIMGEKTPAVVNPGEAFELLVGPWIEKLSADYYRISPLLSNMASDIWPPDEVKSLQAQAVSALLSERTLSPIEISNAFYHGIFGECGEPLMPLITFLLTRERNILPKMIEDLRLLTVIALTPGQIIYPKNPFISISLRHVQFRVASELDKKDTAVEVARAWEHEISTLESGELKDGAQLIFLMETLIRVEVPFTLSDSISKTKAAHKLLSNTSMIKGQKITPSLKVKEATAGLSLLITARCKNHADLIEMLTAIDHEDGETRNLFLSHLGTEADWTNYLISKVYLHEFNATSPEWQQCLDALMRTIELAKSWGSMSLVANAYNFIAVIYDEHLEDTDKAIAFLDEARGVLGNSNLIIENARAMIYFRQSRHEKVLEIYEIILPDWTTTFDPAPLFAYRRAEISAVRLEKWRKVASFASRASEVAKQLHDTVKEIGFKADHAFALWKEGKKRSSIDMFATVLQDFTRLPDTQESLHSFALQKLVGHAVMWMYHDVKNEHVETFPEPPPACFSNHEMDESIKNLPLQPVEFIWLYLTKIELELADDNKIYTYFNEMFSSTKYPVIRVFIHEAKIHYLFRSGNFESLVRDYCDFVSCIEASQKLVANSTDVFSQLNVIKPVKVSDDHIEFIKILLGLATINLLKSNKKVNEFSSKWRADSKKIGILNSSLISWFELLEKAPDMSESELIKIMSSGATSPGGRFIASLQLSLNNNVSPEFVLYSNLVLFNIASNKKYIWGKETEESLEQIITPTWAEIAKTRTFSLLNPKMNVPQILEACNSQCTGFNKIAKVLDASKNAVTLKIPQDLLASIRYHASM